MKRYVELLREKKKLFIGVLLVVNTIAIFGVFQIKLNTDFSIFSSKDSKYQDDLDATEEAFGELSQIIVMLEDNTYDESDKTTLREFQEELETNPHIDAVNGVAPERIFTGDNSVAYEFMLATDLQQFYQNQGDFSPMILKDNNMFYQFTILINDEFDADDVTALEEQLEELGYTYYIAGDFYNQTKIVSYITFILLLLPPLALITILFIFKLQIGSIKATLLSVVPAGIGALWTMGLIGLIGREVSILSAVVPIFVIVIGSADGLHFMSHVQDAKKEGYKQNDIIVHTLKMVGIPMIVTTLTSMVGFLALLSMNTESIVDLAVYAAIGILFAGIATWYVLPLLLTFDLRGLDRIKTVKKRNVSELLKNLWDLPSIVIGVLIIILSAVFIGRVNHEFNMLMVYKDYTVVNQNAEKIDEILGGSLPIYVVYESDSITTLDSYNTVNQLEQDLLQSGAVNKVINPYNFLDLVLKKVSNNQGTFTDESLEGVYNQISSVSGVMVNNLMNNESNKVQLLVFPVDLDNATLGRIEDVALETDQTYVTGVQYMMKDLNDQISMMQFWSIVIALVVVLVMLIVTIRSVKISFISLLPIVLSILAVYAFLGISQISLNVTTTIIFSITIGVGIDYAVHFSSVYHVYLKEEKNRNRAVIKAYQYTARPIIANALGISLGLSILMLSPLQIHFNVSVLMWVSMISGVLFTLTLLPTLLSDISFFKSNK